MRKTFGTRVFLAAGGSALLAAGFVACGGSDPQDVTAAPDAAEASIPDATLDTNKDTGPPDASIDRGPIYDAGPPIVLDGGDLYEGGVPCVLGGLLEEEPNDDEATANLLSPTRCGVIFVNPDRSDAGDAGDAGDAADGGLAENDYVKFQLKTATQSFFLQFAGNVKMDVMVDGSAPVTISSTQSPAVPFVRGQPYSVRVYSADGKRQVWRVTLFEN